MLVMEGLGKSVEPCLCLCVFASIISFSEFRTLFRYASILFITSIPWKENELNMVDTPGHADFGGKVEQVVGMVEGAILVVDAGEGPLAQTKFVLAKALRYGLRPMILLNKVDRPSVSEERCDEVESLVFDLFANLGASEEQLDFPVLYASAKEGWASLTYTKNPPDDAKNMSQLLDAIVKYVPPKTASLDEPFQMLVSMMEKDDYVGRILTGRITSGIVRVNDRVHGLRHSDSGSSKLKMEKGELQLGILLENMRRENFELSFSPPKVMYKIEKGVKLEPIEEVTIEVNEEHVGMVMEALSHRRAEVTDMGPVAGNFGRTRMTLTCPSRGLVGYRSVFSSDTRGTGFMHRAFMGMFFSSIGKF
ncbi:hypothetical protein LXL04_022873 [Taraxacum kok-saghyz]